MFFYLLRLEGYNRGLSVFGSMIYLLSPMVLNNNRTLLGLSLSTVVFSQVLALIVLRGFSGKMKEKVFFSLIFLYITMSENLFFLTMIALIAAYALRDNPRFSGFKSAKEIFSYLHARVRPLMSWKVFLPSLIYVFFLSFFTILTFMGKESGFKYGYYENSLFYLLNEHGGKFDFQVSLEYLSLYWTMVFGEISILWLPLLIVFAVYNTLKHKKDGVCWAFSIIAGLGYGVLWYVLFSDTQDKTIGVAMSYQLYIITPLILITVAGIKDMLQRSSLLKACGILILFLIPVSQLMTDQFLLRTDNKKNTVFLPSIKQNTTGLILDQYPGSICNNRGTKAMGFMFRELMSWKCDTNQNEVISINGLFESRSPKCNTSFAIYADILFDGALKKKYGFREIHNAGFKGGYFAREDSLLGVVVDFSDRPFGGRTDLTKINRNNYSEYKFISDSGKHLGSIFLRPLVTEDSGFSYLPGTYKVSELDPLFDRKYNRLKDYFPDL